MKIIKHGDLDKARKKSLYPLMFTCPDCECIFVADDTDILTAKASLYLVGNWTKIPERASFFSREILLAEQPVFECLKAAEKDYKENL